MDAQVDVLSPGPCGNAPPRTRHRECPICHGRGQVVDAAQFVADAGPTLLIVLGGLALLTGKVILPRELKAAQQRADEYRQERDEFKALTLRSVNVAERAAHIAEREVP